MAAHQERPQGCGIATLQVCREAGVWAYLRLCASDTQLFSGGDSLWLDWTSETILLSLT